jgi:photosystem II stability/assembly factor-like uncharacterized protein
MNRVLLTKCYLIVILLINSIFISAQVNPTTAINEIDIDENSTFFEIQEKMNEYWKSQNIENGYVFKNGEKSKVPGWKSYKRWEYFWQSRVNNETGEFPQTSSTDEYQKYLDKNNSLHKENSFSANWLNLGSNTTPGGYAGLGRINCIAFHPADENTFWVGSPSGGIWKTTDGGNTWTILNNNQLVLGVSDIAVTSNYATSKTLYIATGDRNGGSMWSLAGGQRADNNSIGILKSTDGGATWNTTGLTFLAKDGKSTYRLLIHPTNNSILLAATSNGIYKTTDAGVTWGLKTANRWIDMEFKPGNPNIIIASSLNMNASSVINRSTDNGETWSNYIVEAGGYRNELAVSANNPNIVYMISSSNMSGLKGVYRSTNSGESFARVDDGTKSMLGYYSDGSGENTGQGWYDLTIAASPIDANIVFIGGVNTWKSTNGGTSWVINNMWTSSTFYNKSSAPVVHADKHALVFHNNGTLFEGNDGGIYKSVNGGLSWTDLSNGLEINQIYRIGVAQTNASTILTGLQDNGTKLYKAGFWSDVKGGDGMECIVDHTNPNYMYATYVNGQISRSTNGGTSFATNISANIPGGQPTGYWVTPYVMDYANSAILYGGYDKIWKTTDRGNNWTSISQVLDSVYLLQSLAIAPSNSNVLYAANRTKLWKTTNGGATAWSPVTLISTSNSLTYVSVKDTDPNTLWITYGGYTENFKVFQSTNGGETWTNISLGLPNLPIMSIVHQRSITDRNVLFVGTDVGVYMKDGINPWVSFNNGLPNVVVTEVEIFYGNQPNKLRVGTYGRGLWETEIATPVSVGDSPFSVSSYNLEQNYPNPFNPITNISYQLKEEGLVQLKVYNMLGQEVAQLVNEIKSRGNHRLSFDAKDLPSGMYIYSLRVNEFIQNHKMTLLK